MKQGSMSQGYTTMWDEFVTVNYKDN
ncbi:MAG: hypothetical protein K2Q13_10365 [Nitrosomonas sp.]|nr:hypothetical protein [Nitrosomonas sp.]